MENKNPIDFVKLLYEFKPDLSDDYVLHLTDQMANAINGVPFHVPSYSRKTLSVWKARLRKRGVYIPDRRKRKEN